MYGRETWVIERYEKDKLKAIFVEMWMWRRMTGTSCIKHKTNEAVLVEVNERRTMLNTIMKMKIKLVGHLLRNHMFVVIIMEGKINGKKPRPCKFFFEEILH